MILATSDVASLSRSLSRWELAEYISEGFVILACVGELFADLGDGWLPEKRRKHLERRSTILLVAALSIALICLVRTNELSGSVIGSLGDKAKEADGKALIAIKDSSTALYQAQEAETSAGRAEASLGKAEDESDKARKEASSALALSRGARQEADSFEKDIVLAKKQAAQADLEYQTEHKARLAIEQRMADRKITREQRESMLRTLKGLEPQKIVVQSLLSEGREALQYADQIADVFHSAGWDVTPPDGLGSESVPVVGVFLVSASDEKANRLANIVATVLIAGGLANAPVRLQSGARHPMGDVEIWVGSK